MQMNTRLADFIRAELEPILEEWQDFAKTILHASHMDATGLRDHARDMLLVIADDLESHQTQSEQTAKSKGDGPDDGDESWADVHGGDRQSSGFSVNETFSEFRALRASVVSLWTKAHPTVTGQALEDLTRFHEAIDEAVSDSLEHYATLKESETRLFGAILVASPDPIYVLDRKGRFIFANEATTDLFALKPEAIVGKTHFDLGFPFASDIQHNLNTVVDDQSTYRGKFAHTFSSGQGERFEYVLAPVLTADRQTESIVCIFRDVTERALAEEKTWYDAHHDLLTGLPNRRLFLDRLAQEVKHAKRNSLPLAVLFMDLDDFKEVNDTFGHEVGNRLLAEVAGRLTDCVREDDTVARLGGDEFTVILTGVAQREDAELVARDIIGGLAQPFEIERHSVRIAVSIGISYYPEDASSPVELLEAADQVMYTVKESRSHHMCF